ncbi:hypothetical protein Glove_167g48 [Diversispora epigaea]|uniref:Cation efflux protein transmembrane domain-containing protein n=1 Tax=Diversispora epigaea TaxID=1348612 RepID=A0A397ITV1_9GLOM|nr:hypothetical protein Glove_167g48 [Diversispora epigaea]
MHSLSPHTSTSSSPLLQIPRSTVLRRTPSGSDLDEEETFINEKNTLVDSSNKEETQQHNLSHYQKAHELNIERHKGHNEDNYKHENHQHELGQINAKNVYYHHNVKPLPTLKYIFSSLLPSQKTLFTWGIIHLFLGIILWLKGQWGCGLAVTGFAYLVIFDAMGIFTIFTSSVLATYRSFRISSIRNPFGVQRYEILFGFVNILYLLFVGLYLLKEGFEHLIIETSENHLKSISSPLPMVWILIALCVTLISAIGYQNHLGFCALLKSISFNGRMYQSYYEKLNFGFINFFTLITLFCGVGVITISYLMEQNQNLGWLDNLMSILESFFMFYLAGPVAIALGKILLQTTPEVAFRSLDECMREIQLDPTILSLTATHFWQNSYGQVVGTLCVHVNQEANEQVVLSNVYNRLSPLFINNDGVGELTIQIVK